MSKEACELSAGRLRVRFERHGDRYGHTIFVDGQPALVSVEGGPDDRWPPSPPLQELHEQALTDGRRAIFGVGMAGRSHWSLSVTADGDRLLFEAACRAFGERGTLGSVYEFAPDSEPPQFSAATGARLVRADDRLHVSPEAAVTTWSWSAK